MRILVIASQYPALDKPEINSSTLFMHNYAKNWSNLGHTVDVIHLIRKFPKIYSLVIKLLTLFSRNVTKKFDSFLIQEKELNFSTYTEDKVNITRLPIKKNLPHGLYPKKEVKRISKKIVQEIQKKNRDYDLIVVDFLNPGLFVSLNIREELKFKTNIYSILHETDFNYLNNKKTNEIFLDKLKNIDGVGFRSTLKAQEFIDNFFLPNYYFKVFSGVPQNILLKNAKPGKTPLNFLSVGRLIKSKNMDKLIKVFVELRKSYPVTLQIIGEGPEFEKLENIIKENAAGEYCILVKKMKHSDVIKEMNKSDGFILISEKETFGMVYIEAMSQGCITIGSKGQGIESIIKHNENGFLVDPSNISEVVNTLLDLLNYDQQKLNTISINTFNTMKKLTDENLSEEILKYFDHRKESI